MAREPQKIKVMPGGELSQLLAKAGVAPLLLETDGELYRLERMQTEQEDIWDSYDGRKVTQALKRSAGALAGIDRKALLKDIHEQRAQDSSGRPS